MKTVLLVDKDLVSQAVALCAFNPLPDFQLVLASSFHEALWAMCDREVDLVIVHLGLPDREGLDLLAYLANYRPKLPVLTLCRMEPGVGMGGALSWRGHLSLPLQPHVLISRVKDSLRTVERGEYRPLMLHDLLRVLSHERETCILQVKERLSSGHFKLARGKIVSAACGALEGEAAIREMLSWQSAWFRVEPIPARLYAPLQVEVLTPVPLAS